MTEREEREKSLIFVVHWKHLDGSGFGLIRGFEDSDDAKDFQELMEEHGDKGKEYSIAPVEMQVY